MENTCGWCHKPKHNETTCFERIKSEILIPQVLAHYGIELNEKRRAQCPLPGHQGERKNRPFAVSPEGRGFQCFSCRAKGNVIGLVQQMEGATASEAAKLLSSWFGNGSKPQPEPVAKPEQPPEAAPEQPTGDGLRNIPLKEKWKTDRPELKGIDPGHAYLANRGFERGHCEYLGVGYFPGRGQMAGRVVFPIHDKLGELVGYAGRRIDDELAEEEHPRWKFPPGFHKSLELYNYHRVLRGECESVIVVESFWGALACVRAGLMNAVALMGRDLSEAQEELLRGFPEVVLMMDGDGPGREASSEIGKRLLTNIPAGRRSIRVVLLPDDSQPDELPESELLALL